MAGRCEGKVPASSPPTQNQKLGCSLEGHLESHKVTRECLGSLVAGQKGVAVPSGTHREHRTESLMGTAKRMAAEEQQGLGKSAEFQKAHCESSRESECSGLEGA